MPRIKIKDLPKDMKISKAEMKKIRGGLRIGMDPQPSPAPATSLQAPVGLKGLQMPDGKLYTIPGPA